MAHYMWIQDALLAETPMSRSSLQLARVQRTDCRYLVGHLHSQEVRCCNITLPAETKFEFLKCRDEVTAVGAQIRVSRLCKKEVKELMC